MYFNLLKCVCDNVDIQKYVDHYNFIKSGMINPSWLGNFNYDKVKFMLENGSKIWLYMEDDEIVCSMMYIPADQSTIDLFGLNLLADMIGECGPIMVSEKYRGHGLQREMLKVLNKYCSSIGNKYILTTIHPDNSYSKKNFEKCGYMYYKTVNLKRGDRDLLLKKI